MERSLKRRKKRRENPAKLRRTPSRLHHNTAKQGLSVRLGECLTGYAEKLGGWTYDFVRHHWLGIVNFHLLIFIAGALETPLFVHLDQQWIARLFYAFYGFFCHQEPSRSLFLFGNQVAICSRCLGFYTSLLVFGLLVGIRGFKPLSKKSASLLAMPAVLDVLLQALHLNESTNLIRITTGLLLGMAVSLYLLPRAKQSVDRTNRGQNGSSLETALSR